MTDWSEKLLDLVTGGLGTVAGAVVPAHVKKHAAARLDDFNPFSVIAGNHDLLRAVRIAWIAATLAILDAARSGAIDRGDDASSPVRSFDAIVRPRLIALRLAAFDRRGAAGNTAIDTHVAVVLQGTSEFVSVSGDHSLGKGLDRSFSATLADIAGWPIAEIPAVLGQIAAVGLQTHDGGAHRRFGDLVFAAFAELIKSPDAYPEAREAFHIDMQNAARHLGQALRKVVEGVDLKLDGMEDAAERRHREVLDAIAREKGVDPRELIPLLDNIDQQGDVSVADIPRLLRQQIDAMRAAGDRALEPSNEGADIDQVRQASRDALRQARTDEALSILNRQVAVELAMLEDRRRRAITLLRDRVEVERLRFDHDAAKATLRQVLAIDPEDVWCWIDLGDLWMTTGSLANAEHAYRSAMAAAARCGNQRDLSVSHEKIGDVLVSQGQLASGLSSFRASLAIAEELAAADPGNAVWQRDLSVSHNKVGDVLVSQGQLASGLSSFRASLAIAEQLAAADPGNAGWQRDLAISYGRIAAAEALGDAVEQAAGNFQRGREIILRLIALSPDNAGLPGDLAWFDSQISKLGDREAG